jgi:hypothetical protein
MTLVHLPPAPCRTMVAVITDAPAVDAILDHYTLGHRGRPSGRPVVISPRRTISGHPTVERPNPLRRLRASSDRIV